eukprot:CAMPEP_0182509930 /NCGR_PEP_ID=MMETSP1321-20130603/27695_1 /TAXON_ID=91990 /ORGANISM="Bolidomonas sp., Strain RCC1657" /LENGTH=286 /DNA_ID=CAMNT_0024716307 /DNA_START=91 /DNA_END=948 /DNA_ORIENTATION=+
MASRAFTLLLLLPLISAMVFTPPRRVPPSTFTPKPSSSSSHPVPSPSPSTFSPPEMFTESIDKISPLTFQDFYHHQMSWMEENLAGLKEITETVPAKFVKMENEKKKVRIIQRYFTSDLYRKIRILYYDGGPNAQVFNSLLYPSYDYDMPVLGIDLLQFSHKKHLTVIDFQPLHDDHPPFEPSLANIKKEYPELNGQMSSKFYDETQFFSKELLFARFEDVELVNDKLYPAFEKYLDQHHDMISGQEKVDDEKRAVLEERQREYDVYSAERDPATGMFGAMFGKEW